MTQEQAPQSTAPERKPDYTAEELYLVVRAQQRQISELVAFTEELNSRLKKWEMFFGEKFSGIFAGDVGTVEDQELKPIALPEHLAKGFGALLNGEGIAGNAPPSAPVEIEQDTQPHQPSGE